MLEFGIAVESKKAEDKKKRWAGGGRPTFTVLGSWIVHVAFCTFTFIFPQGVFTGGCPTDIWM